MNVYRGALPGDGVVVATATAALPDPIVGLTAIVGVKPSAPSFPLTPGEPEGPTGPGAPEGIPSVSFLSEVE